jgi:O-succinylbenzoic acid--CoA ligase
LEGAMELIIRNGNVLDAVEHFPEIKLWVDDWLSNKSNFQFETSGTSGVRKQLIFSRTQLIASAKRTCDFFHLGSGTKVLHRLPMQFVAGKMNIVRALLAGHSVWVEQPSMHFNLPWNPENIQWDWWTTTPAMLAAFLEAKLDPNVFQKILLGGGKVPTQLRNQLINFNGHCFESYGATETLTHIAVRSIMPIPSHFRLFDGVSVMEHQDGIEIHDNVTKIQVSLNDALHFYGENEFEVLGRLDDVINSGGLKIHPLLVEEVLAHWSSLPFYITQSPDNKWGKAVTLVVLKSDILEWKSLNLKLIFENHPNWRPRKIVLVQKMDRNENGKIVRKYNPEGMVDSI